MGKPIRIVELARRMISLAGFVPEKDIPIKFVGIRDGEKLHEELFDEDEVLEHTDLPGIHLARSPIQDFPKMLTLCDRITSASRSEDAETITAMLRDALQSEKCSLIRGDSQPQTRYVAAAE